MKKKFIVTGGAGFIGSHLVDLLIKNKHEVIIIDDLSTGSIKNINEKAIFKKINLNNLKKIDPFLKIVMVFFTLQPYQEFNHLLKNLYCTIK